MNSHTQLPLEDYKFGGTYLFLEVRMDPTDELYGANPIAAEPGSAPWDGSILSLSLLECRLIKDELYWTDETKTTEERFSVFRAKNGYGYMMHSLLDNKTPATERGVTEMHGDFANARHFYDFQLVFNSVLKCTWEDPAAMVAQEFHANAHRMHRHLRHLLASRAADPDASIWTLTVDKPY